VNAKRAVSDLTPAEAGRELARSLPPMPADRVRAAARILATVEPDQQLAETG
jgi:hypothetical protein